MPRLTVQLFTLGILLLFSACTSISDNSNNIKHIESITISGYKAFQIDDSTFYVKLPYDIDVTSLRIQLISNAKVSIGDNEIPDILDLSNPITIHTILGGGSKKYTLSVIYSNLPIIYINTLSPITSKDDWMKNGTIQIVNAGEYNLILDKVQMKGRGNSTWVQPKKPYAIKLDKKTALFGLPNHKRWVLLANYLDKSSLRTEASMYMGRMTSLDYTPRTVFVELVLNGEYQGLYQFTEQLKIDENRVDVGDDGFLLEVDARAGQDPEDVYFSVDQINHPVLIKDPDIIKGSEDFNYIQSYLTCVSQALATLHNDKNSTEYENLIDLDSFVDWYLVNEITRNNDACFFSSCYMNLKRGEKLKMGPLWDFDMAIGNSPYNDSENPIGFWLRNTIPWYVTLFESPDFISKLKLHFNELYYHKEDLYSYIHSQGYHIQEASIGNELKWNSLNVGQTPDGITQACESEIEKVINWLDTRLNWMKSEFDSMGD